MARKKEIKEESGAVVKRGKKAGIFSLIVCLLVAVVIWCYAEAQAKKEELEASKDNKTIIVEKNSVTESIDIDTEANES